MYLSKKKYGHLVTLGGFRAERKAIAPCDKQVVQMATCQLRQIPRFTHFICHVSTCFVATKFKSGISDSSRFTFWHVYALCNKIPQSATGCAIRGSHRAWVHMDYYTAHTRALSSMAQTCRNVAATNPYLVPRLRTRSFYVTPPCILTGYMHKITYLTRGIRCLY
jgi:hypothetical protein